MKDILTYMIACTLSIVFFFHIIPKRNPYRFPEASKIDKYTYVDDNGVCYKYVRKYL